ncbi:MAG: helix-turn-helix domain-containing protein [Halobacteriaceae archaeon]
MTRARLSVSVPAGTWRGDASRDDPEARFRTTAMTLDGDTAVEVVTVSGPARDCLASMRDHPSVTAVSVLDEADEITVEVVSERSPLLRASAESRAAVETPFDVVNGEATIDVTSTHEGLSSFGDELRSRGLDFVVEYVQSTADEGAALTPSQQSLLLTAVEEGYYETPRRCTLTDVAEDAGIAKSTCSETLQRVESAVVDHFLRDARLSLRDESGRGEPTPERRVPAPECPTN